MVPPMAGCFTSWKIPSRNGRELGVPLWLRKPPDLSNYPMIIPIHIVPHLSSTDHCEPSLQWLCPCLLCFTPRSRRSTADFEVRRKRPSPFRSSCGSRSCPEKRWSRWALSAAGSVALEWFYVGFNGKTMESISMSVSSSLDFLNNWGTPKSSIFVRIFWF